MLELLAPAQNKECAIAAIDFGADAVYIGATNFGARKSASNTINEIKEVVEYAHKFYVKIYVTINTILNDSELEEAVLLIHQLYEIGVDAIIVQDMGLLEKKLPPIPLFASTQCNITTPEKVQFLSDAGFSRIILARELSIQQIKEISNKTNAEIETFVHGALCVSYSGQCYFSFANGGRSANRGECAQPCRKKYTLIDENGTIIAKDKHLLSLKDFNASEKLQTLADAGVTSFKIEGRLKDVNYVKNVVGFYRQQLDKIAPKTSSGKIFFDFTPALEKSFNRGFCEYFLEKRSKCFNFSTPKSLGEKVGKVFKSKQEYFEYVGEKLNPQDGLCWLDDGELKGFLVNKVIENKIFPNKYIDIPKGTELFRNFDFEFQKRLANSKTCRKIAVNFIIFDDKILVTDENGNSADIKITSFSSAQNTKKMKETLTAQLQKTGESDFFVNEILFNTTKIRFIKISELNNLRRQLLAHLMTVRLNNYNRPQPKQIAHPLAPFCEMNFSANVHNKSARNFYEKCGCKITENSMESTKNIYKKPLMRTKHCLKFAFGMCKNETKLFLIDEKGKKYALNFDCKSCEMSIFAKTD